MSKQAVRQFEHKQICFIDDSKTSAYVTKKLLKQHGYSFVDHFPNAEVALEALMENDYDLVITDLMISSSGGVNGDDLIRLIRHSGHPSKSTIPIMVVTGAREKEIYDELMAAGADRVLTKPIDGQLLRDAIQVLAPGLGESKAADPEVLIENIEPVSKGAAIKSGSIDRTETSSQLKTGVSVTSDSEDLELDNQYNIASQKTTLSHFLDNKSSSDIDAKAQLIAEQSTKVKTADVKKPEEQKSALPTMKPSSQELNVPILTRVAESENKGNNTAKSEELANRAITQQIEELSKPLQEKLTGPQSKPSRSTNPATVPLSKRTRVSKRAETNNTSDEPIEVIFAEDGMNSLKSTSKTGNFQSLDVKKTTALNTEEKDVAPLSMIESIQKGMTQTNGSMKEKAVKEKIQLSDNDSQNVEKEKQATKPIEVKSGSDTKKTGSNLSAESKSAEPKSAGPNESESKAAVQKKPSSTGDSRTATPKASPTPATESTNAVEDNPLLALLDHMDDADAGADFKTPPKGKKKPTGSQKKISLSKGIWIILLAAMVVPAVIFWYLGQRAVDVKIIGVEQGSIHNEISVPGRVVSKRNIKVSAQTAGQLMAVLIKEGEKVEKGQTLARMDDKEARSNVNRMQARLINIQEEVAATSKTQERLQRALDLGAVSRQVVEDAEAAWKSSSAKQSEIEEELISAKLKLNRLQIKAPFSGLITAVSVQEGQWISRAENLLTLVDMNQRVAEIRVDVSDTARLNIGQEVMLSSEAFEGRHWQEKILKIGEEAKTEDSVTVIKVQTSLGEKAPKLRVGQQVDAEIRVASRSNTLLLPHNILFTHDGSTHAAIVENGKIVFVPVVTGIESATHIELVKGLREGQEVVVPNELPLEPGMNVVVTNSNRTLSEITGSSKL